MAISFVAAANGYDSGSATTVTSTQNTGLTLNVLAGDHLFIAGSFFATGSPSIAIADTSGNTIDPIEEATGTDGGSGQPYTVKTWQVKSAIADAAYVVTITLGSAQLQKGLVVIQSRGLAADPLDQHGVKVDDVGSASVSTDAFTTTVADEILIYAAHQTWGATGPYYTAVGGFHIDGNSVTATYGLVVEYKVVSAIQTNTTISFIAGGSGTWQTAYASFKGSGRRFVMVP